MTYEMYPKVGVTSDSPPPVPPPPGSIANYTYTAATLAARPPISSLANGTLVFVESQRSWYRSDLAGNTWVREPIADATWMAQAAWGLDSVTGSDENIGTVASPIRTLGEMLARVPNIVLATTLTIAAGSTVGDIIWRPISGGGSLTIIGARTLGANRTVLTSSDETATNAPLIDAGAALTVGALIQSTSGATSGAIAGVLALVSGTQYRTTPWRTSAGARAAPPAATTTVAVVTLTPVPSFSVAADGNVTASNLAIAALVDSNIQICVFNACTFATQTFLSFGFYGFFGCLFTGGLVIEAPGCTFLLSGFIGAGSGSEVAVRGPGVAFFQNCVLQGRGMLINDGGYADLQRLGIMGSSNIALQAVRGGTFHAIGTLYGSGNALAGTDVRENGHGFVVAAVTPTLAAAGQELQLEAAATANPTLLGIPQAAAPMVSWAQWVATFGRQVMSYTSGASINNE